MDPIPHVKRQGKLDYIRLTIVRTMIVRTTGRVCCQA